MKNRFIIVSLFIFISVGLFSQQQNKVVVYQDTDIEVSVFLNSIVKENEYITFWSNWEYKTQKPRNELINNLINIIKKYDKDKNIDFIKWSSFKSIKEQVCIDVSDKTINILQYIYYTNSGNFLYQNIQKQNKQSLAIMQGFV